MDILNEERFEKGGVVLERLHPELAIEPFIPYYERMGYNVTINKLPNGWTEIIGEKKFSKGGKTRSTWSIKQDRRFLSQEPWEQAYKPKRKGNYFAKGGEVKYNIIDKATKNVLESYSDPIEAEENLRELNLATKQDWGKKDHYTIEVVSTYAEGGEVCPTCGSFAKGGKTKINWSEYYEKGGTIMSKEMQDKLFDSDGTRKIDRKSIKELTDYVNSLEQTKSKHFNEKTKKYSPERQKLHKQILNEFKDNLVCIESDEPIAILMGGSPASGKSTFLRKYAPYLLSEELLRIDADEVRSMLPEYEGWNASQTHLETKDIVNTLLSDRTIGLPCNFDLIYDGTMNNTKSYLPLIKLLKELGYKIFVVYIDNVPKDVIIDRALKRYQSSGRFVPLEVIDDFFNKGKSALNEIKKQVDGYMIIDGGNKNYEVIEERGMKLPQNREYSKIGSRIK